MRIHCECGAKYAFEVPPEQARQPVSFVCPACGLDSSAYVTQLVRQEFGIASTAPGVAPAPEIALPPGGAIVVTSVTATAPPPAPHSPPPASVQIRLHRGGAQPSEAAAPEPEPSFCPKHPGVQTTEQCRVCEKPICPKCMEGLGYVCSPLCRQKADLKGISIPVFAGQRSVREARKWRVVGGITAGAGAVIVALLGFWFWYAWIGSVPRVGFSVRFETPAYSGASVLCGQDQIVFLHGGTLARLDLRLKEQIWSVELVDKNTIAQEVEQTLKSYRAAQQRLNDTNPDADPIKIPSPDKLTKLAERSAAAALELRVVGQNIWVAAPGKLVQHDWATGKAGKEIATRGSFHGLMARGEELLMLEERPDKEIVTHINLATGATREEEIRQLAKAASPNQAGQSRIASTGARTIRKTPAAGLPVGAAGQDGGKPLDPGKVEQEFSQLPLAGRIASPAVLSANRAQERALAEMNGTTDRKPATVEAGSLPADQFVLIPARDGYVQFSARLIEQRMVARQAMKAPLKTSALNGTVNMAATADIANKILNEIQRDRGGATVMEDESRYQVSVRRADGQAAWTAEVIGPPSLFPLRSVNVVTANQKLIVLDKNNQKLWESPLTYNVVGGASDEDAATGGEGPCVERGNTLYVFDQGVLTAFDLKTGNAQWRLPSVGISGLFFDDQGMVYVNSTTAGPESIKYSRQIDVNAKSSGVILKLDPRSGKTLWSRETPSAVAYLSGPYIYTLQSFESYEDAEAGSPYVVQTGLETQPFVRIKRLNPRNGKDLWEHVEQRAPLAVRFDRNTIHLVFKKELQVLKFLSL